MRPLPTGHFAESFRRSLRIFALLILTAALLTAPLITCFSDETPKEPRVPNIVLIVADDLGYGELGCYGQKKIHTPRLDLMAKEGIRFTQFYAGSPVCAPSRCSLLTGKHTGHAAVRDNRERKPEGQFPLPIEEVTLSQLLHAEGYKTAAIGKWGLGAMDSTGSPLKHGFGTFFGFACQRRAHNHFPASLWKNEMLVDLFDDEATKKHGKPSEGLFGAFEKFGTNYDGDLFEEEAIKFIREEQEHPFFLYVPFTAPHLALQVPDESLRQYEDKWDDPAYDGKQGYLPHPTPRAAYAAMITRLDRSVGRILDEIKELNLDDNTIVLFTSDNGPAPLNVGGVDVKFFESAGPLRGLKGSCYEGGLRVPLIVRWPEKIVPARECRTPWAMYDILPTLCAVAAIEPPTQIDGRSFATALTGGTGAVEHDFLYWEFAGYEGFQTARMGDWKAIRSHLKSGSESIELYNLAIDVAETNNVAEEHPELVKKAKAIFATQHVPNEAFPLPMIDQETKKPDRKM